ncbi:conjugal transfer protein TraG N-terminal domain-containing protein [Kordiimonas pumila]|uniref:Conjugal transfer protein TraG N-terminal domain-containing protein n=1 Tax=Kordiimonas pumila TaxID=2161677 RepID=A0ABV7D597_9PROT|nr:conjugal transfer protein TraG N-terminal domain-containing protein [Kordiimonas pumila]
MLERRLLIALLWLILALSPAHAVEQDYITYGGIHALSAAFRYVALFFSNGDYGGLVYITAVIGFVVSAFVSIRHGGRDDRTIGNWLLTFAMSVGLYTAFIVPKGTIHIYDRTLNAYEPVSGVPDGIILVAGLTNTLEEVAVDIANTVSLTPYENTAGGIVFELIRSTFKTERPIDDAYLWENIKTYYIECGQVAAALPGSGFTLNALNRTSTNLLSTLGNAQSAAVAVPYRTEADPVGTMTSCTDAYGLIQSALNDPATYTSVVAGLCRSVGFDTADAGQLGQCHTILDDIIPDIFGQVGDRLTYLQSASIAMAIQDAAADLNPERAIAQETNRRFIIQGVGLFSFAQEYGPAIRAGFLAAALTTLVVTTLFILTPWRNRAFSLSIGFFVFVAVWGIIDIGLQVVIEEIALDAFEEVKRSNLAFDAFMLTPPATVKALGVFGASRLISITLASTIVVTIFRLSGASFGQLTSTLARHGEDVGGGAAEARLDPERLASGTQARAEAVGSLRGMSAEGTGAFRGMTEMAEGRLVGELSRHGAFVSGGHTMGFGMEDIYRKSGSIEGGRAAGQVEGFMRNIDGAPEDMAVVAQDQAATASERSILEAGAYENAAANLASGAGIGLSDAKSLMAGYEHALLTGRITGAEGDLGRVLSTATLEEGQRIGAAGGVGLAATHANMTPAQIAEAEGFLNTLYGAGETLFAERAQADDLTRVSRAGEVRRERQVGEVEGLEKAAAYRGSDLNAMSRQAAGTNAAEHVLGADRLTSFAGDHGISAEDILFARGSNYELAVNARTLEAFGPQLTEGQLEVARPGSSMALSFDPHTGEIGRIDVRSGQSGSLDNTTHIQDGYRVDARQGTEGGMSLFRFADLNDAGNMQGAAQFASAYLTADREGSDRSFGDSVAQQASSYLSNIAGKQVSYLESNSSTGTAETYAAIKGSGGFRVFGVGITGEAGAKGSRAWSDVDSKQLVNSFDYWNDQARNVYDQTLGNSEFDGDHIKRSSAFLKGISDLREQAVDIKAWVKDQEHEDRQSMSTEDVQSSAQEEDANRTIKPSYPRGFRAH